MKVNVYKRKDSQYYWLSYYNSKGKRIRKSLETTKKADALELASKYQKKLWLIEEGLLEVEKPKHTINDLADDFIDNVVDENNKSEDSKNTDKRWINRFLDFVKPTTLLSDVAEKQVNDFVSYYQSKTIADTTLVKASKILSSMFKYSLRPPYDRTYNPIEWSQKVKQLETKGEKGLPIPWELIIKAIETTKNVNDKMFWTMLAYTGMSEIDTPLVTKDDFERGYFKRHKTSVRFAIWLHPEIAKFGDAIFGLYPAKHHRDDSGRRFKKITGWTLKSIRKTFASNLLTQFKSADDAIAYTGHTNVKTLIEHYATVDPKEAQSTIAQMFSAKA